MTNAAKVPWKTVKKKDTFDMNLLRLSTCGSVDDGKSTLIGRLLYDSKSILIDQYEAIEAASLRRGEAAVNLALLTDGLKAEREQGITIDVAYRYFNTPHRKFIIADTPGHIQYTRNMVTGASTADVALILVDARQGIVEQTRRHAIITSLLQIPHMVLCVNKMDLVGWDKEVFERIRDEFTDFVSKLQINDLQFIPISALLGDNIVDRSEHMDWYEGTTLLYYLEHVHTGSDFNLIDCRFPVQYVVRPQRQEFHDYRGYAGTIAGGIFKPGDEVMLLPSGFRTRIARIDSPMGALEEAYAPMAVTMLLEDDYDLSRGDMIVRPNNQPDATQDIEVMLCWLSDRPPLPRSRYILRHTTQELKAMVTEVRYKLDINTLHRDPDNRQLQMNDVARVVLRTTKPVYTDPYRRNRATGSMILIDEATNNTVAAAMVME
jgi:sulfate adenylyltransferase subunit 1